MGKMTEPTSMSRTATISHCSRFSKFVCTPRAQTKCLKIRYREARQLDSGTSPVLTIFGELQESYTSPPQSVPLITSSPTRMEHIPCPPIIEQKPPPSTIVHVAPEPAPTEQKPPGAELEQLPPGLLAEQLTFAPLAEQAPLPLPAEHVWASFEAEHSLAEVVEQ